MTKKLKFLVFLTFWSYQLWGFNFLVNIFYSILPKPLQMAFRGEGLNIDQLEYGLGSCNFLSLGYLNSDISYKAGLNINENFSFKVPTFYLYGNYIAHISTPIIKIIYPGWELQTEIGLGGIEYHPEFKANYRKFFFTGTSGFNWKIYQSKKTTINLGLGYKLHYILKDLLYLNIQAGVLLSSKYSISLEYLDTFKGGNFFIFYSESQKIYSKEKDLSLSLNILVSKKHLLKFSLKYKNWYLNEIKDIEIDQKLNFYGVVISLLSR